MNSSEFQKIKKKYSEKMAKLCRSLFPGLTGVYDFLVKNFERSSYLYEDLVNAEVVDDFKNYVYSKLKNIENRKDFESVETPEILMKKAGYILKECYTEEDIQENRKYYAPLETLCTFRDRRLKKCRVFFAIKENVREIKRDDFPDPERQDEYGTSVLSIQFDLDENHMLSIKNRYNHTVIDPDATFSNNLDNIAPGLTASFEQHYDLRQGILQGDLNIPSYVRDSKGKFYRYNYEINGIYFCTNNVIIENGVARRLEFEKYILMDYFILDLANKKIELVSDIGKNDDFVSELTNILNVKITKNGSTKCVIITRNDGGIIELKLDKYNRIIEYSNDRIVSVDTFLQHNTVLQKADMPFLKKIGANAFARKSLESFTIPNGVQYIKSGAFENCKLTHIIIPTSVQSIGDDAFSNNQLVSVIIPSGVQYIGDDAFSNNQLTQLEIPNSVKYIGDGAFCMNNLFSVTISHGVQNIGNRSFYNNRLVKIELPTSVQSIGDLAFSNNELIEVIIPSSIQDIGFKAFDSKTKLLYRDILKPKVLRI